MALPASPPINMHQIQDEFGAPRGTPLASFLRGGAWVPNSPANAGVPTALPIDMLDLLGATNTPPVHLTNRAVSSFRVGAGAVNASFQLGNDGSVYVTKTPSGGGTGPIPGEWMVSGVPSAYEAVVTITSPIGTGVSGPTGVLNLGTSRSWTAACPATGIQYDGGTVNIIIRPAGGGAPLASATITIDCSREF